MQAAAKRALRIADNKIAMNAGWDVDLLRVELEEIQAEGLNLELTGFAIGEIDVILASSPDPDGEVIPAVPGTSSPSGAIFGYAVLIGSDAATCSTAIRLLR